MCRVSLGGWIRITSVSETEKETSTESIDVNTKKPTTSEQAPTSRSAEPVEYT